MMIPEKIENHIDNKVRVMLSDGHDFAYITKSLKENIDRFSTRKDFIAVSKRYLINNWNQIHFKKRYTTYYVIHSAKRIKDIKWILDNQHSFEGFNNRKLFGILLLKDKLRKKC